MARPRASETIAAKLREEIFAGLRPGDRVGTESELAERFGVSRITMRDAVRMLESEGLMEVTVGIGGGLRVSGGDPARAADALAAQLYLEDVAWEELVDAMRVLEPATARLAALRATPEDVARLRALIAESQGEDATAFTRQALDLHLTLAEISGNRALMAAVRALRGAQQQRFAPETSPTVVKSVNEMHTRLVDAIEAGDPAQAMSVMNEHLDRIGSAAH